MVILFWSDENFDFFLSSFIFGDNDEFWNNSSKETPKCLKILFFYSVLSVSVSCSEHTKCEIANLSDNASFTSSKFPFFLLFLYNGEMIKLRIFLLQFRSASKYYSEFSIPYFRYGCRIIFVFFPKLVIYIFYFTMIKQFLKETVPCRQNVPSLSILEILTNFTLNKKLLKKNIILSIRNIFLL